ncbi:MAG: OprO/OprP family phosphate-selective porin [Puniceicoccales bacterium]|nr:OprO/OprP family phosphate-selective porin [Puniceicoccales bacterium]
MKKNTASQPARSRAATRPAALAALLAFAAPLFAPDGARASDSGPLLDTLARKGVITAQEAEDLRAELSAENNASLFAQIAKGKVTQSLTFSGRLQVQYNGFSDNVDGNSPTSHVFLRRVYFGVDASLPKDFSASLNYDFAASSFDKLFISWNPKLGANPLSHLSLDVGLRKVNLGLEETTSSGSLESIERSAATRYFAEDFNGRRLGGASYRIGVFLDGNKSAASGKSAGFFYGAAITNPERVGTVTSIGDAVTNTVALWGNLGFTQMLGKEAKFTGGMGAGIIPGQGGVYKDAAGATKTSENDDLVVESIYGTLTAGKFTLKAEVLVSMSENDTIAYGANKGKKQDTNAWGFWIQPSFRVIDELEVVARYSYLDSDGRGIKLSDGVRNAPSAKSATAKALHEWYCGLNYYIIGNDVKLQLGYAGGKAVAATGKDETAHGFRSQFQVNF